MKNDWSRYPERKRKIISTISGRKKLFNFMVVIWTSGYSSITCGFHTYPSCHPFPGRPPGFIAHKYARLPTTHTTSQLIFIYITCVTRSLCLPLIRAWSSVFSDIASFHHPGASVISISSKWMPTLKKMDTALPILGN